MSALCGKNLRANAASSKITRIDFLSNLVTAINGKVSAADSKFNGQSIVVKKGRDKLIVCEKSVSSKKLKYYMKKYNLSNSQAEIYAAALTLGLIGSKTFALPKKNITMAEASVILAKASELLYGKNYCVSTGRVLTEEDIDFVINNRLNGIDTLTNKTNKRWIAKSYAYGLISGKSDGEYKNTRTISCKNKVDKKQCEMMIDRLVCGEKRIVLSDDWQVCRTSKLPKNADMYKYIVDSFPNEYYQTGFNGITNKKALALAQTSIHEKLKTSIGLLFVSPAELMEFNTYSYPWQNNSFVRTGQEYEYSNRNDRIPAELVDSSIEFYKYALNVDYRNIESNEEWKSVMGKYLSAVEINEYINSCKRNKTIIECDLVAADKSACYWYDSQYNCKIYAHFRVLSDIPLSNGDAGPETDNKYGTLFPVKKGKEQGERYTRLLLGKEYMDYKIGEWTDFYFNSSALSNIYGSLNTSYTLWDIMIDYTGEYPWLLKYPYLNN